MRHVIPVLSALAGAALLGLALAAGAIPPGAAPGLLGAASALVGLAGVAWLAASLVRAAKAAAKRRPGAGVGWFLAATVTFGGIHAALSHLLFAMGMAQADANRDMRALEAIASVVDFPLSAFERLGVGPWPLLGIPVNSPFWGALAAGSVWVLTSRWRRTWPEL